MLLPPTLSPASSLEHDHSVFWSGQSPAASGFTSEPGPMTPVFDPSTDSAAAWSTVLAALRAALHLVHLALWLSAPLAYASVVLLPLFHDRLPLSQPLLAVTFLYALSEVAFHLLFLQRRRSLLHPHAHPALPFASEAERRRVIRRIMEGFGSVDERRRWVEEWFFRRADGEKEWEGRGGQVRFDELERGNLEDLVAAVLFSADPTHLCPSARQQLSSDVDFVAPYLDASWPAGDDVRADGVEVMRHTLEPIKAAHRPLAFYALVAMSRLCVEGLYFAVEWRKYTVRVEGHDLGYWFHPGWGKKGKKEEAGKKSPIVIVAGIGGLVTIPHFAIALLWKTRRAVFLVGNESVSMRAMSNLVSEPVSSPPSEPESPLHDPVLESNPHSHSPLWHLHPHASSSSRRSAIPPVSTQSHALRLVLRRHGFVPVREASEGTEGGAVLVGHSLGTQAVSLLARQEGTDGWVSKAVFIDPICFWWPHLLKTFVYKRPETAGELLVRLVAREIGIATVIQRHFLWFQFAAFARPLASKDAPEDDGGEGTYLSPSNCHFVLSEHDALVRIGEVDRYLETVGMPRTHLKDAPHGGFLFSWSRMQTVIDVVDGAQEAPKGPAKKAPAKTGSVRRPNRRRTSSISVRLPSSSTIASLTALSTCASPAPTRPDMQRWRSGGLPGKGVAEIRQRSRGNSLSFVGLVAA